MSESVSGREPLQIVQLEVPRCALTYGSAPCTAAIPTTGSKKCFNSRFTCQDPANYDSSNAIRWRFGKSITRLPMEEFGEAGGVISTNVIPSLVSTSTAPSRINAGNGREGESPFGLRARVDVVLQDHQWDDSVDDPYLADRSYSNSLERGTFWSKWKARNPYHANLKLTVYDGYVGEALSAMRSRLYLVEGIDGPDANGRVRITASDPLRQVDDKRAQFPSVTQAELRDSIDSSQTTGIVVACEEEELTKAFGNTGSTRYIRTEDEIILYTGYTPDSTEWELTGVTRAALGTTADSHDADEKCQRVGRYESLECWKIARDLLENHAVGLSDYINDAEWDTEGDSYLPSFTVSGTVADPTPVTDLAGELTEQCLFYLWWDDRNQKIDMRAVRPAHNDPITEINDDQHIIANSLRLKEEPKNRISRIFLYYGVKDPTKKADEVGNYSQVRGRIDLDAETPDQYNEIRTRRVFSRWIQTAAQAVTTTLRLLTRYRNTPKLVEFKLDAKDRALWNAGVVDLTTRIIVDDEGAQTPTRWQVISAEEILPGQVVRYDLQRFEFWGRIWVWMADDAPAYGDASEEEKANGSWWADTNGEVGSGEEGYRWI